MPGALAGFRIVDLTNIILGPYGTMLLADQSADVIKVEAPEGDVVRHIGKPGKTPMGPTYLYVNRNKRSLCSTSRTRRRARLCSRSSRAPTPSCMPSDPRQSRGWGWATRRSAR